MSARDFQALLFAERERASQQAGFGVQTYQLQHVHGALACVRRSRDGRTAVMDSELDILEHRESAERTNNLVGAGDALLNQGGRAGARDIAAAEMYFS